MKNASLIIILLLALFACKKHEPDPGPPPPDGTEDTFHIPQTRDIVLYEVNLRAYSQAGDLKGVTARLGEIKSLGVNVIWLMPIYPVGQVNSVNSPYCVKDYKQVGAEYGSLGDLKELVKEAHKKDLAVILDWVANHTAWDNPWITNKDWYTQDGSGNIIHPPGTNWQDVADLDYSNAEMRQEMITSMKYWITAADIDGFRCDAADFVPYDFWSEAIADINASMVKELIWLAEGSRTDHFAAGFHLNWGWSFYDKIKNVIINGQPASGLVTVHIQEYNGVPQGKHRLRFTTNHDESAWDATPMTLFGGEKGALAASASAIFLGGVPLIYGSQEVGTVTNIPFFSNQPINWSLNPGMLQSYKDLMEVYNSTEELKTGLLMSKSNANVLAFTRTDGNREVFVFINLREDDLNFTLPLEMQGSQWTNAFDGSGITLGNAIALQGFEYNVLKRQKTSAH